MARKQNRGEKLSTSLFYGWKEGARSLFSYHQELGKEIFSLALPTIFENLFQTLVGFLDTLVIARLSLVAVTVVGLANSLLNVYLAIYLAIGVGGTALIARNIGAKQLYKAREVARQTQDVTLAVGLVFGLVSLVFGRGMLQVMGADQASLEDAQVFLTWVGGLSVLQASMTGLSTILRASGDSLTPMKVGVITNLVNLILDYILVFGLGKWQGLGILGTALGTVVARLVACYLLSRKLKATDLAFQKRIRSRFQDYRELVALLLPASLERLLMRLGQVVYFGLIVGMGTTVYAAHMIAGSIEAFTYMPAYGLALAASILIGQAVGSGEVRKIRAIAFLSSVYGVGIMSLMGIGLFSTAPSLALLFTQEEMAQSMVVLALKVAAFNQFGLAISMIIAGALQGLGDTKTPLYSTLIGMWGLRVLGVYGFGTLGGLGILGIWLAILIDLWIRSLFLSWTFVRRVFQIRNQADF